MLKNIIVLIFLASFLSGCMLAGAIPLAITGGLAGGSIAAYALTPSPRDAYLYINSPLPEEPMTCFASLAKPGTDVFYYTGVSGQIWIGEEGTKNWLKRKNWEAKFGEIKEGEINDEFSPR